MLCIPPRWKTVFADFVAQRAQADAQQFSCVGSIAVGKGQCALQVQPLDLTDGDAGTGFGNIFGTRRLMLKLPETPSRSIERRLRAFRSR